MARNHARIRLDIWADDDWRDLTSTAQWLYLFLLSTPSLTFAGIADWRPGRIAANAADLMREDVETFAAELIAGRFILVDAETEEVLVRSFVKHDGLMASPNVAAAFVKAHAAIASPVLRAVVVDQLQHLHDAQPDLRGFTRREVQRLLEKRSTPFAVAREALTAALPETLRETLRVALPETPRETPSDQESNPSGNPSSTPAPSPCSISGTTSSARSESHQGGPALARAELDKARRTA